VQTVTMPDMATDEKKDRHKRRAVTIRLPDDVLDPVEAWCELHDRTFTSVVDKALREYMARYGNAVPVEQQAVDPPPAAKRKK